MRSITRSPNPTMPHRNVPSRVLPSILIVPFRTPARNASNGRSDAMTSSTVARSVVTVAIGAGQPFASKA